MCQTLLEDERLDASNLLQSPDPLVQLLRSQGLAVEIHAAHLPTSNDVPGVEYPQRGRDADREIAISGSGTEERCKPIL
jgi:hypothetical protein